MTVQNQVTADVIYAEEDVFGEAAIAADTEAKKLRRVSTSLALGKDVYTSAEARADLQIADARHGTKRPGGGVDGELASAAYDDFLEALLRGTWAAGTTSAAADYTTVASGNTSGNALAKLSLGTFTWAAGDPVAKGFRKGDVIRTVGSTGNDTTNFRIVGFSGGSNRIIAVTPSPVTQAAAAITSFNVAGKKVTNGVLRRSFTIEGSNPDIDVSELYTGMRCGSGNFRIQPNGMVTASFGFMGRNMEILEGGAAPYFTDTDAQGTGATFAGPSGTIRLAGGERGIVTGLEIAIDNNLSADPVIGSDVVPEIYYGSMMVTGSITYFLQDAVLLSAFVNETICDIASTLYGNASGLADFLSFSAHKVKLNGASKTVGAQGGVVVTSPFQMLLADAATGITASTLTIQRSNA